MLSLSSVLRASSLLACPGVSEMGLGWKVLSAGAEPAGRTWAEKVGTASLPILVPIACFRMVSTWSEMLIRGSTHTARL